MIVFGFFYLSKLKKVLTFYFLAVDSRTVSMTYPTLKLASLLRIEYIMPILQMAIHLKGKEREREREFERENKS